MEVVVEAQPLDLQELTVGQGKEGKRSHPFLVVTDGTWRSRILGTAQASVSGQLPGDHTDRWETFF